MSGLKVGDTFPEGVAFTYVPYTPESAEITACGAPQKYDISQAAKDKKVVIVAVPGAFTPTCQVAHIPSYTSNIDQLKAKGVDQVVVIACNDPFVMSAWGKANKVSDDYMIFASDMNVEFSKSIGRVGPSGDRTARYAIIVDHGKVVYVEQDDTRGSIEKSGGEAVLSKL